MKKTLKKAICLFIAIALNWSGLFAIGQTVAYFHDTETSKDNAMQAGQLDFILSAEKDFEPDIASLQNSTKIITVQDNSTMDYNYRVRVANPVGGLCDYLLLTDSDTSALQPLTSFVSNEFLYSEKQEWTFTASLNVENQGWEGKLCQFDFVYEGWQENMPYNGGFTDTEIISNLITNIEQEIPTCMKINEVYYDPGVRENTSGLESDPNDEWIELYNNCDYEVNLKDWYLYDNNSSEHLNHNYIILPYQFVVIAANASTWTYWPDIPENAFKIALGGTRMFDGLSNSGDVVLLHDNQGNRIDEVSWGTNTTGLDPSVPDVPEGHSISRKEKGVDTDTNVDWMDTYGGSTPPGPNPGTNPHAPDGSLLLPFIFVDGVIQIVDDTENSETINQEINKSRNQEIEDGGEEEEVGGEEDGREEDSPLTRGARGVSGEMQEQDQEEIKKLKNDEIIESNSVSEESAAGEEIDSEEEDIETDEEIGNENQTDETIEPTSASDEATEGEEVEEQIEDTPILEDQGMATDETSEEEYTTSEEEQETIEEEILEIINDIVNDVYDIPYEDGEEYEDDENVEEETLEQNQEEIEKFRNSPNEIKETISRGKEIEIIEGKDEAEDEISGEEYGGEEYSPLSKEDSVEMQEQEEIESSFADSRRPKPMASDEATEDTESTAGEEESLIEDNEDTKAETPTETEENNINTPEEVE